MEVKNAFVVLEPQRHKSQEAADPVGIPGPRQARGRLSRAPFPRDPGALLPAGRSLPGL